MDLFQPEESCWATQKANKMLVKSVFSVQKVLRLWVHGVWCGGVWHIGTNILVEPGISIFRVRRRELSYPEEGGQQVPPNCLGLSTKPHGVTCHDFILNKLKSPLHITCLGLIYMSTRLVELHTEFPERYAVSFSLHKHMVMSALWTCLALRIYSCCVFRCHFNSRIWV